MLIFPGAFNPLHAGHLNMACCAEKQVKEDCRFIIATKNPDKPELTQEEVERRLVQFERLCRDAISMPCTTIVEIVRRICGNVFCKDTINVVVGADTILRIDDPKYYYDSILERDRIIRLLRGYGTKFIVCERGGESMDTLRHKLSPGLFSICLKCEGYTDNGLSSTRIRAAKT